MSISFSVLPAVAMLFIVGCKETVSNFVDAQKDESVPSIANNKETDPLLPAEMPVVIEDPGLFPNLLPQIPYPIGGFTLGGGGRRPGNDCSRVEGTSCNTGELAPCDDGSIICVDGQPVCEPVIPICATCSADETANLGLSCNTGDDAPCDAGTIYCDEGELVCHTNESACETQFFYQA